MDKRNGSGLAGPAVIIALLAALGLGPGLRRSPAPPGAPTATNWIGAKSQSEPAAAENGGYEHGAGRLLEKFFATYVDDVESSKIWSTQKQLDPNAADKGFASDDPRADYSVRFLIATLPLPTSPPLRYLFDSEIDALQSAAATKGYALDSFDLPWLDEAKNSPGKYALSDEIDIASSGADGKKHSLAVKPNTDDEERWKRDSGVILFRQEDPRQLLVVFVVDETPTRGINQVAMRDALDQIAWLEGWEAQTANGPLPPSAHLKAAVKQFHDLNDTFGDPQNEIRIVGPAFSGSTSSLRNVLEDWRSLAPAKLNLPANFVIRIVSGTATAVQGKILNRDDDLSAITFNAVQIPDPVAWNDIVPDILNEIANVGRTSIPLTEDPKRIPKIVLLGEDTSYGMAAGAVEEGATIKMSYPGAIIKMSFPLHISALRAAYKSDQAGNRAHSDLGHHNLDLPEEVGQQRQDVIPSVSPRAAMYDELVLGNLFNTIRRERIRYVGIVATDVEDLVFLVQQIRTYCPDTVVFTTSADVLYLHSEVNNELRGMLVFTTYPLFSELQNWTFPFRYERKPFSSDSAYGVYNATVALLGDRQSMLDYGEPFFDWPQRPKLQIGIVGRDEIWPLAFQDGYAHDVLKNNPFISRDEKVRSDLGHIGAPAFTVLFFILNVGLLISSLALLWGKRWGWCADRWWLAALLKDEDPQNQTESYLGLVRYLCRLSLASGMLIAEIIGLGFVRLPLHIVSRLNGFNLDISLSLRCVQWLEILTAVIVLLAWAQSLPMSATISVAAAESLPAWIPSRLRKVIWPYGLPIIISTASIGLAILFVARLWIDIDPAFALFAFLRATHLHSGVSPLTPLIFLGIAGFALVACHFWRIAMLEDRPFPLPFLPKEKETASFHGVNALQDRVTEAIRGSLKGLTVARCLVLFLIVAFTYFGLSKLGGAFSVDGWRFDILFILLGFGAYSIFALVFLRFTLSWFALRQLLRRLYFHPSRYSYKNLQMATQPGHLEQQRIRLFEPRSDLTAIEYSLGCARAIIRIAGSTGLNEPKVEPNPEKVEPKAAGNPQKFEPPTSDLVKVVRESKLEATVKDAETQLLELLKKDAWEESTRARKLLNETMTKLTGILICLFEPMWRLSAPEPSLQVLHLGDGEEMGTDRVLLQQAELFAASRVVDFVRHVFPHLINLIGFAMPAVLAMMLAISDYPFPAHDTLLWVSWTVLLSAIVISLSVFVSINRNPIISMVTGTEPGQFNWDSAFTVHLLLFAVIPVLTLLGAQYPQALSGGLSWIGSIFGGGGSSQ